MQLAIVIELLLVNISSGFYDSNNQNWNNCSSTNQPECVRLFYKKGDDLLKTPSNPFNMRAWRCHGRTNKEMVDRLAEASIIRSATVRDIMYAVDRGNYAPSRDAAYDDCPQPLGFGQTISAPHMHAHVLEELVPPLLAAASENPEKTFSVLDVGSGSGYLTACFGRLFQSSKDQPVVAPVPIKGRVKGIDVVPELIPLSIQNTKKEDADLLESGTVSLELADGWNGLPKAAPFQAIHVGAAAETFPHELMMQLDVGGIMIIPVGPELGGQALYRVTRVKESSRGRFNQEDFSLKQLLGVRYVPLVKHRRN